MPPPRAAPRPAHKTNNLSYYYFINPLKNIYRNAENQDNNWKSKFLGERGADFFSKIVGGGAFCQPFLQKYDNQK